MSKKQTLHRKIDQFLTGRKKSDGGYAPVDPSELEQLYGIMRSLIEMKYERDPDGDLPVEASLTDRTRYMRPMSLPVRYAHLTKDPLHGKPGASLEPMSELELHLQAADRFAAMAASYSELNSRHLRVAQELLRENVRDHKPIVLGGTSFSVRPPADVTVEQVQAKLLALVKAALKKGAVPSDYTARTAWSEAIAKKASEALGLKVRNPVATTIDGGVRMFFEVPCFNKNFRVQVTTEDKAKTKAAEGKLPSQPA